MRIGFLFNHDQVHQVAHTMPVAVGLACARGEFEIVAATTSARLTTEVLPRERVPAGMRASAELGFGGPTKRMTLWRWGWVAFASSFVGDLVHAEPARLFRLRADPVDTALMRFGVQGGVSVGSLQLHPGHPGDAAAPQTYRLALRRRF